MDLGKYIKNFIEYATVIAIISIIVIALTVVVYPKIPKYSLLSALKDGSLRNKAVASTNDNFINSVALEYDVDNMFVTLRLESGEIKEYKLNSPLASVIGYSSLDKDTLSKLSVYLYNEGYVNDIAIVYWNEDTKELVFSYGEEFRGKQTVVFDGESFKTKR